MDSSANVCPVCNEAFMTNAQLNRHLDDVHFSGTGSSVMTSAQTTGSSQSSGSFSKFAMFKQQPSTASRTISTLSSSSPSFLGLKKSLSGFNFNRIIEDIKDDIQEEPDPMRRDHWQLNDKCSNTACGKQLVTLGIRSGINCRQCGLMFCDEHVSFEIKLNARAEHDLNGVWSRVCFECFRKRRGFGDFGRIRSRTGEFLAERTERVSGVQIEYNRLMKRLEKLRVFHEQFSRSLVPQGRYKSLREAEKSVSEWEDDRSVLKCPFCATMFNSLLMKRKHHCRLCGKIMCGNCSKTIKLPNTKQEQSADAKNDALIVKLRSNISSTSSQSAIELKESTGKLGEVRICLRCKELVIDRNDFFKDKDKQPSVVIAYESLIKTKQKILSLLPDYNELLNRVEALKQDQDYLTASEKRKELLQLFAELDTVSKRILKLQTTSVESERVNRNIFQATNQFLQENMLTLQVLPKLVKEQHKEALLPDVEEPSQDKKEFLQVLLEQKQQLEDQIAHLTKLRQIQDVLLLQKSLKEIEAEISLLKNQT